MTPEHDPDLLGKIVAGVGSAFFLMVGWVYRGISTRVNEVKTVADSALPKADFQVYVEQADRTRAELRESSSRLFDKITDLERLTTDRHIELLNVLRETKQ